MNYLKFNFVVGVVFLFSACSFLKGSAADPEAALPLDPVFVFEIDHSNEEQVANLKSVTEKFPELAFLSEIKKNFDGEAGFQYAEFLPLLQGSWKFYFALESVPEAEKSEEYPYVSFWSENAELTDALLVKHLEETGFGELKIREEDKKKYYTVEAEDLYAAQYKDVFVFSSTPENLQAALLRLEEGLGFDSSALADLSEDSDQRLGYFYIDPQKYIDTIPEFGFSPQTYLLRASARTFLDFEEQWLVFSADQDGLKMNGVSVIPSDSELGDLKLQDTTELKLLSKAPADGLFAYFETYSSLHHLKVISQAYTSLMKDINPGSEPLNMSNEFVLEQLAAAFDFEPDEFEKLFNGSFAVTINNIGETYPGIALYFDFSENPDLAVKFADSFDKYVEELIVETMDEALPEVLQSDDIALLLPLNDGETEIDDATFHKWTFDFDILSDEEKNTYEPFIEQLEKNALENAALYYGLTEDDTFIVALYPNFEEVYGENVLKDDADFKRANGKLGLSLAEKLLYVRPAVFRSYLDSIILRQAEEGNVIYDQKSYSVARSIIGTFQYFIFGEKSDDNKLSFSSYLSVAKFSDPDLEYPEPEEEPTESVLEPEPQKRSRGE